MGLVLMLFYATSAVALDGPCCIMSRRHICAFLGVFSWALPPSSLHPALPCPIPLRRSGRRRESDRGGDREFEARSGGIEPETPRRAPSLPALARSLPSCRSLQPWHSDVVGFELEGGGQACASTGGAGAAAVQVVGDPHLRASASLAPPPPPPP